MILYRYHNGSHWDEWLSHNKSDVVTVPLRILYQRFAVPFDPDKRAIWLQMGDAVIVSDWDADTPCTTLHAPVGCTTTVEVSFIDRQSVNPPPGGIIKTHPSYQQYADYLTRGVLPKRLRRGVPGNATARRSWTNNCRRRFRVFRGQLQQRARVAAGEPKFIGRQTTVKVTDSNIRVHIFDILSTYANHICSL